ncbi:acylneuraminate cytidylyltransferase family protein [bacterium]|nr:acylneuraminate cytidylyltransferase family protein [bacterium]
MIAIIPARSGSKGLQDKNIKDLQGFPMIDYTIKEALKSKYITDVIISTNCSEIEKIALRCGAKSPFLRPEYLASDDSKAIDNYIYTVNRLNLDFDFKISDFVVLQPTSPLRTVDDIDGAIELYVKNEADSVISYTEEHHPIEWHKYLTNDGKFENIFRDRLQNRQQNRISYYPNGAIFVFKFELIKKYKYYSDASYAFLMPRCRSIDVDTIEDFNYIEYIMRSV